MRLLVGNTGLIGKTLKDEIEFEMKAFVLRYCILPKITRYINVVKMKNKNKYLR